METHTTPAPETVHRPVIGFTLSPPLQKEEVTPSYLLRMFFDVAKALNKFCIDYQVYPEFDDKGRLHYHGILHCYDLTKFRRSCGALQRFGFVKYETKSRGSQYLNLPRWTEYCKKDVTETQKVFPSLTLPLTKSSIALERRWVTHNKKAVSGLVPQWMDGDDSSSSEEFTAPPKVSRPLKRTEPLCRTMTVCISSDEEAAERRARLSPPR